MPRRSSAAQKQRKVALVFAGPGDSTLDNTSDLLDDFLGAKNGEMPDEDVLDIQIAVPVSKAFLAHKGFKTVIEWLDNHELAFDAITDITETPNNTVNDVAKYAESQTPSKNIPKSLMDWLRSKQEDGYDEARLVLLWGEEGDETSEIMLDLASSFDIKALDLTAGLDDISFDESDEEEAAEPEPEPEPEPVKKDRSRRRRSAEPEPTPEDVADAEAAAAGDPPFEPTPPEEQTQPVEKKTRSRRASAPKAKEPEPTPEGEETLQETIARVKAEEAEIDPTDPALRQGTWTDFINERVALQHVSHARAILNRVGEFLRDMEGLYAQQAFVRTIEASNWLTMLDAQEYVASTAPEEPAEVAQEAEEEPKRGRGRPRTRSASQRAVTEYYDEDEQTWVRAGRGRLPAGVKTRKVDPETGDVVS